MAELEEQRRKFDSPDGSTVDDSNPSFESGPDDVKQPDDFKGPDKVEVPDDRERNAENETPNAIGAAPPVPEREAEQRSPEEEVWQSLVHSVSPSLRTDLIHRFHLYGISPETIFNRLTIETDFFIQQALIQSLGEYSLDEIGSDQSGPIREWLENAYRNHSDAGVHSSAEWTYSR